MKTLVIHPYDTTTLVLENVYHNADVDVLHRSDLTRQDVENAIDAGGYDRLVLLGHGTPEGLYNFATNDYVFDRGTYRDKVLPRNIEVIAVWCNANDFFLHFDEPENVFATGMFISELREAKDYFLHEATEETIYNQFVLFSKVLRTAAYLPIKDVRNYIEKNYVGLDEVTKFNRECMCM